MESIAAAIAKARSDGQITAPASSSVVSRPVSEPEATEPPELLRTFALSESHLERHRIVSFDATDERSRPFDMLRTQVLREMEANKWRVLAVTSPTSSCGTTTMAANLALSIARQQERTVLLVDLNLRKPDIAGLFGLGAGPGLPEYLNGKATLKNVIVKTCIADKSALVLGSPEPTANSSDLLASSQMASLVRRLRRELKDTIIIFDMPPMLVTDDTLALMPEIDCVLLVLAVGQSTIADLEACRDHLEPSKLVKVVLNKERQPTATMR